MRKVALNDLLHPSSPHLFIPPDLELCQIRSCSSYKHRMLNFGPKRVREAAQANALSPSDVESPLAADALENNAGFQEAVESNVRFMQDIMVRYDTDADGMLSKEECKALMTDLGGRRPTEAEVLMVFASCDANHDGMIGLDELTKVLVVYMAHTSQDKEGSQWGSHWFWWRLWQWTKAFFFT